MLRPRNNSIGSTNYADCENQKLKIPIFALSFALVSEERVSYSKSLFFSTLAVNSEWQKSANRMPVDPCGFALVGNGFFLRHHPRPAWRSINGPHH